MPLQRKKGFLIDYVNGLDQDASPNPYGKQRRERGGDEVTSSPESESLQLSDSPELLFRIEIDPEPEPSNLFPLTTRVKVVPPPTTWPENVQNPPVNPNWMFPMPRMDFGEGIVRWSPTTYRQELLCITIAGASLTRYYATGKAFPSLHEFTPASTHRDFPAITTYDWSPQINGLVAVGTKGGEVHLLRIDDSSNDTVILPLKLQRTCQAVSFNKTGLLAVGLDRVRNDQCLQIWDINERLSNWEPNKYGWALPDCKTDFQPIRKLEPSLPVTSTRFFEDQPQTLVAGIKNQRLTIHDLRDPDGVVLSFNTRNNNNIAIDHCDPNYFASSNLEGPGVTIWDKRAGASSVSKTYAEKVASGALPMGCVLNVRCALDHNKKATIRSLRYNPDQRGMLGVLSNSGELQVLRTVNEYTDHNDNPHDGPELLREGKSEVIVTPTTDAAVHTPFSGQICSFDWVKLGTDKCQPRVVTRGLDASLHITVVPDETRNLFGLLDVSSNKQKVDHLALPVFDDPNETIDVYGPMAYSVMGRDVEFGQQPLSPRQTQEGSIIGPRSTKDPLSKTADAIYSSVALRHSTLAKKSEQGSSLGLFNDESGQGKHSKIYPSSRERHVQNFHKALDSEINNNAYGALSLVTRERATKGYLFDCKNNQVIVQDDPWLQDVWSWIDGAREVAQGEGMQDGKLDLAFMGVHGIWTEDLGFNASTRIIGNGETPEGHDWTSTISSINRRAGHGMFEGVETSKPHHRQLCLAICGWGKSPEELDFDLSVFEKKGQHTKAAVWALCEKQPERAVEALQRGGSDYMFIALALELQTQGAAPIDKSRWDVLIGQNEQMAEDPYLRAIYALISTSDWRSIADEASLPLRERVGIALRNLNDNELTKWLTATLQDAVNAGDIEGIVLAGLTDKFMDIVATYVTVFGDIQSAVLVMSFTVPAYFEDIRFNAFRAEYRRYLNNHRLHIKRALLDAQAGKLSKLRATGKSKLPESPRQVTLRCVHCNSGISNDRINTDLEVKHSAPADRPHNPLFSSGIHSGIACPNCGKHLPRCAVCLQTLGLPRSDLQSRITSSIGTNTEEQKENLQKNFITFCMKCPHAMHADHAAEWFKKHVECPVIDCKCRCYEDEARIRKERAVRDEFERKLAERRKNATGEGTWQAGAGESGNQPNGL